MNTACQSSRSLEHRSRRGAAAVECAIVLPLLTLLLLGAIDVGQFANVYQVVSDASRQGARVAARDGTQSTAQAVSAVRDYLEDAFPGVMSSTLAAAADISVTDSGGNPIPSGDLQSLPSGTQLAVQVSVQFDPIRWIRSVKSLDGTELSATTKMRRE